MQAVSTPNLYCLSLFSRAPGTNNDRSVVQLDPFFHKILNGFNFCRQSFLISDESFDRYYFLADAIYPRWSIFATPIPVPTTSAEKRYTERQESSRKDVERFFGVLKQRFKIIRTGNRIEFRDKDLVTEIVTACVILHNMICRSCLTEAPPSSVKKPDDDEIRGLDLLLEFEDPIPDSSDEAAIKDFIGALVQYSLNVASESEHTRLKSALVKVFSTRF